MLLEKVPGSQLVRTCPPSVKSEVSLPCYKNPVDSIMSQLNLAFFVAPDI